MGYFLVTGKPPFTGQNVVEIAGHHLHTTPQSPSERLGRSVPPKLEALLVACLAKDPDARPRDAQALLTALLDCEVGEPVERDCWPALGGRIGTRPITALRLPSYRLRPADPKSRACAVPAA